jgi:hypothetical protein
VLTYKGEAEKPTMNAAREHISSGPTQNEAENSSSKINAMQKDQANTGKGRVRKASKRATVLGLARSR